MTSLPYVGSRTETYDPKKGLMMGYVGSRRAPPPAPPLPPMFDLNNPEFLKGLLNTSQFDFLKNPNLPQGSSEGYFQDFLKNINAPSSVDAVQKNLESQQLMELLSGIDTDTSKAVGSTTMDFFDRGLTGPGATSDIAENALAQIRGEAGRAKTGARLAFAGQDLGRLKAREEAARGAYGTRYGVGAAADTQARNIYARGGEKFADIASSKTSQFYNNLLESLLKSKGFDVSNNQFFRGLENKNAQDALARTAAYDTAILNKSQQGGQGFMDSLRQGLDVTKSVVDLGTGLFGKKKLPKDEGGYEGGIF